MSRWFEASLARLRPLLSDDYVDDGGDGGDDGSGHEHEQGGDRWDMWRGAAKMAAGHRLLADTTVAVLVAMISSVWLVHHSISGLTTWLVQLGLIVPLVWRRRFPVGVFLFISVVALVQWSLGAELVADLALLVALYTVASNRPKVVAVVAAVVLETGAVMASFRWSLAGSWVRSLVFLSGLAAAAVLLGANLRARRGRLAALTERADRLERERDQQALIAAAAERTRIAREMHDIIAHSLAVMIGLADGATAKLHSDPDRAKDAIQNVSTIGRQALGDTRRLLGVLRADNQPDGLAPQPGIAQVEALLASVRSTGLKAALNIGGQQRPLPPGAQLTVYRIVQEATTNVLKHAVQATSLTVDLDYEADVLTICVEDDGRSPSDRRLDQAAIGGGGHGLAGMRERACVYDGEVSAGPSLTGWRVKATIPIGPVSEDPSSGRAQVEPSGQLPAASAQRVPSQSSEPSSAPLPLAHQAPR